MARTIKRLLISNTGLGTVASPIAASASVSTKFTTGFPTGDTLIHKIALRYSGNLNLSTSSAGSVITRGGLQNIRGLWLSTPQHQVLINGLDGISLHNLQYLNDGQRPVNTDISAATTGTPTFNYHVPLMFRDRLAARPEDTSIDMYKCTYMELVLNNGGGSDFISGGTYTTETLQVLNVEMHADVDPGPVDAKDLPLFRPYLDIAKIPINQTQSAFQIFLPYGGRIIKRYMIQQRNSSTLAELANTVVGANDTDRISFLVGGYPWISRLEWLALQDENANELRLSGAVPTGAACLNWAQMDHNGYMASDMLGLNSQTGATPQVEIDVDVTSVSNGQLWIVTQALTPIPFDAQRPKPAAETAK